MATANHTTTFWHFLENYSIEIPIIQRDYAQGRLGKENLRKNFLNDLKEALDKSNNEMKLDFVYGSSEDGKLYPLDGQQRLTTLWLLHWYIALKAGKLKEASDHLKNFSYETRVSSRNFCEEMCRPKNFEYFNGNDVVDFITNQTWFYSAWKQDPTIQSMLRMLGGCKHKNDINDGIEKVFSFCSCNKNRNFTEETHLSENCQTFIGYYRVLTSNDCPIVFYYLPKDFGNSDDLYIKMNARGEQLTSFENFKADLIGYITKQSENELFDESKRAEWKKLLDPESGIPKKLDTDWTDIFWKNKSKDYKIDEIYFAFLNRFILNELICQKDEIKTEEKIEVNYAFTAEYLEKENNKFKYLYGDKGNDSKLEYKDLGDYLYYSDGIPFELFESLQNTLNNYHNKIINVNDYFPKWVNSNFEFIPCYNDEGITILGQKERIVFLAVCRYFENNSFDEIKFKQWMRIVWNIVENSGVETISAMVGVMRLLDELSIHSHDIYNYLKNDKNIIKSKAANDQVKEERAKAKQILKNEKLWEPLITTAEEPEYLKGKVAALFNVDEAGSFLLYDDDNDFKKRYEIINEISSDKEDKYHFIKIILSYCDKDTPWANLNLSEFKSCLNDATLINCFRVIDKNEINPDIRYQWIEQLVNTQVLNNSRGKYLREGKPYLFATEGRTWNAYGNVILDKMHCNNAVFSNLVNYGSIQTNHKVNDCDCFWGWDINFKYKNYFFRWNGNNEFYLMEDNWKSYKKRPTLTEEMSSDEKFYIFKINNNMKTIDEFTSELDCLIVQAFPEESDKACCNDCQNKVCE